MQTRTSVTAKEIVNQLNEKGLKLSVVYSDGRYFCRAVYPDNRFVAVASCKSLIEAVTKTIEKA